MSLLDNDMSSLELQRAFANAELHSTLLLHLLMGIYTGVYAATVRIYCTSYQAGAPHTRVVLGALTALYSTILAETCLNWYFIGSDGTPVVHVVFDILPKFEFLLADGLMVWRCFHASGQGDRLFLLPMGLYALEFALSMVYIVLTSLMNLQPGFDTEERSKQLGDIQGTLYAAVAATSLISSLIICRNIYVKTAANQQFRRRYRHIIDILVQSAAVHSTSMLLAAILQYLETGHSTKSTSIDVSLYYFIPLSVPVLGLAPTLMVARLAVASYKRAQDEASVYTLSGLTHQLHNLEFKIDFPTAQGHHHEEEDDYEDTVIDIRSISNTTRTAEECV